MSSATGKGHCVTCGKEKSAVRCEGCQQLFCFPHLTDHRQELSVQLDDIEINRDFFLQTLNEQTTNPTKHSLIKQIDQWEDESIIKIQRTAKECRELVLQHTTGHIHQIEVNLTKLTDQLRQTRKENDFNEMDLQQLKQKLIQLTEELDKPSNISVQRDSTSFINKITVVVLSSRECVDYKSLYQRNNFKEKIKSFLKV
jgi:hypothetical protein